MGRLTDAVADGDENDVEAVEELTDVAKRRKLLKASKRKLDGLDKEDEKLAADKQANSKERGNIFRELKTQLGMKREDAEFALRLINLDQEERDKALDALREFMDTFEIPIQDTLFAPRGRLN